MRFNIDQILPELTRVSAGRDYILTPEFSATFGCAEQTARKNYCLTGECYGVRPIKIGNRLLWPVAQIAARLQGGAK